MGREESSRAGALTPHYSPACRIFNWPCTLLCFRKPAGKAFSHRTSVRYRPGHDPRVRVPLSRKHCRNEYPHAISEKRGSFPLTFALHAPTLFPQGGISVCVIPSPDKGMDDTQISGRARRKGNQGDRPALFLAEFPGNVPGASAVKAPPLTSPGFFMKKDSETFPMSFFDPDEFR